MLACGLCKGTKQLFDGYEWQDCSSCEDGYDTSWIEVILEIIQQDGSVTTERTEEEVKEACDLCDGAGGENVATYRPCEHCDATGEGDVLFTCGECVGTGDRKTKWGHLWNPRGWERFDDE